MADDQQVDEPIDNVPDENDLASRWQTPEDNSDYQNSNNPQGGSNGAGLQNVANNVSNVASNFSPRLQAKKKEHERRQRLGQKFDKAKHEKSFIKHRVVPTLAKSYSRTNPIHYREFKKKQKEIRKLGREGEKNVKRGDKLSETPIVGDQLAKGFDKKAKIADEKLKLAQKEQKKNAIKLKVQIAKGMAKDATTPQGWVRGCFRWFGFCFVLSILGVGGITTGILALCGVI